MGTGIASFTFWGVNSCIMAVTMATSHLMTGRCILIFGLNSLIFILHSGNFFYSLPYYGNDIT